jgi:penicillin-binding protein 1A
VPRAIELMPIDAKSGKRAIFGQEGVILEAFKPGDEPPDATKVIGEQTLTAAAQNPDGGVVLVPPSQEAQPALPADPPLTGQGGGLY